MRSVPILLALFLAVGCGKDLERSAPSAAPASVATNGAAAAPGAALIAPAARAKRITIETNLLVTHVDEAVAAIRRATEGAGGYVSDGRVSGSGDGQHASLELRVPADKLAQFRTDLAKLGDTVSDAEKAEDVTEQRADIGARLSNARAEEKRLLALLSDHTGSLGDVIQVEKELSTVRENIERTEAQERTLEGQIAFATVKLDLSTKLFGEASSSRILRAASDGIGAAHTLVVGIAIVIAAAGPSFIVLGILGYAAFVLLRIWQRRRALARPVVRPVPGA